MEAVGNASCCCHFNHGVHHVARTCHAEAYVACTFQHEGGGFDEVFRSLLHGDTAQEGDYLFLSVFTLFALFGHHVEDVARKGIDGVVHGDALGRVLMVVVDDGLPGEFGHAHDAVGVVHTILFDAVDSGVDIAA